MCVCEGCRVCALEATGVALSQMGYWRLRPSALLRLTITALALAFLIHNKQAAVQPEPGLHDLSCELVRLAVPSLSGCGYVELVRLADCVYVPTGCV